MFRPLFFLGLTILFSISFLPAQCDLEPEKGPCSASITRYYFDSDDGDCKTFIWGGCGGNANNYETYQLCMESCAGTCYQLPDSGPCLAALERWYFDFEEGQCKTFIWGGCGGNDNRYLTKTECMESCGDVCYLPPEAGPCAGFFLRYYYNPEIDDCQTFVYGGCGGNGNNYITYTSCMSSCAPVCKQPKEAGPCLAVIPRYFYNLNTRKCERFVWGGCGANQNNFSTFTECQNRCPCEDDVEDDFYYASSLYRSVGADNSLTSLSVVTDSSRVTYSATAFIEFLPGFSVSGSGELVAQLEGCLE